jgi:hypothetical protein
MVMATEKGMHRRQTEIAQSAHEEKDHGTQ